MPHINNKQLNKNIRNYIKHSKLRERTNRQARFIPEALLLLVYHRHKFDHHCCAVPSHPHPYPSLPSHTRTQSYIPPPTPTPSLSLSLAVSLSLSVSVCLSVSLVHTQTHTHIHIRKRARAHAHRQLIDQERQDC